VYGLNSLLVIGAECVKGVRMVYGTSLMGHCMSESLSTAPLDGTAYTLAQGHAPLLQNKPTTSLTQTVPYSQNLFAAYRGWGSTQEDGWAFNRDVAKRGSFDYFTRKLIKTSSLFLTPADALSEHNFEWDLLLQPDADQAWPAASRTATRQQQQALSTGKYALNRRIASEYSKFHDSKKKMYRQSPHQVSLLGGAQDFSVPEEGSFFSKGDAVICCNVVDVAAEEEKAFQAAERRRAFASSGGGQRAARTTLPAHLRPLASATAAPVWSPLAFSADALGAYRELARLLRTHGFVGVFCQDPELLEKARALFSRLLDDADDGDWTRKKIAAPMSGTLGRVSACFLVAARSPSSPNPEQFFFSCAGKDEIERTARDLALLKSVVAELAPACCLAATCRLGFEVLHLDQMNIGDKFCNRTGQKSTVCSLVPAYELPRTCDGRVPAVLLGPSQMMRGTPNDVYNTVHNSFVIQNPDLNHVLNTHFGHVQPMSEQIIAGTAFQSRWGSPQHPQPAPATQPKAISPQPPATTTSRNIQIAHAYLLHKNSELGLHTVLDTEITTKIDQAWQKTSVASEIVRDGPSVTDEDWRLRRVLACALRQYLYWRCYGCCAKILHLPARRQIEERVLAPAGRAWRRLRTVDSFRQLLEGEGKNNSPRPGPARSHDEDLAGVLSLQALQLLAVLQPDTFSGTKGTTAASSGPATAEDFSFSTEEDPGQLARLLSHRLRPLFSRLLLVCHELALGLETSDQSSAAPRRHLLLEDYLPGVKWFNRLQRARGDRVHRYEQDRDLAARDLKTLHHSPIQGKTHAGARQDMRCYWRKSSQRLLNPCFDMNLDSVANPTFAGVQTFLKNTKTALCQFKSRHTGPKDPSTHQGVKCSEIYGASRMGHMEIDAITQVGSGRMLDQIIESSDKKQIAVCGRCRGIGKISQTTGEMSCFNLGCLQQDRDAGGNPHMRAVTTTHTLLKLVSTLNATGVSVEIT
jgi:hypothetical protein